LLANIHGPSAAAAIAEELQLGPVSHGQLDERSGVLPDDLHTEHVDREGPHPRDVRRADADPPDALHLHVSTLRHSDTAAEPRTCVTPPRVV